MHSDTSELRQLVESQSRLGKVLEEQCQSLDRWIGAMEQHVGKESKEMNQASSSRHRQGMVMQRQTRQTDRGRGQHERTTTRQSGREAGSAGSVLGSLTPDAAG